MPAARARIVLTTVGDEPEAESLARILVDDRLAACVNIVGPIRSVYRWRDAVEDEREYLLLIKTRPSLLGRVQSRVNELHSYELPEILVLTPDNGSAEYLSWIFESTGTQRPAANRTARKGRGRR
jgi:periplasmic divalent cation tolerance protein